MKKRKITITFRVNANGFAFLGDNRKDIRALVKSMVRGQNPFPKKLKIKVGKRA